MMKSLSNLWDTRPLLIILILAAIFRLISAIFSKGYGMSDDHFLVIEPAQRWLDGHHDWFEKKSSARRSIVYPGLHYILFYGLKKAQITDPQTKMLIVRLIHAAYSLLIVWIGFLLTRQLSNDKTARQAGLILALLWILPVMSVRNLIEVVCIPPAMLAFYLALITKPNQQEKAWFLVGVLFGLSFTFRYQMLVMIAGFGLVLFFQQTIKSFFVFLIGCLIGAFVFQGIVDWLVWGFPFLSFYNYTIFNIHNRYNYVIGPWYEYFGLIFAVFIPPISFLLGYGFLRTMKKHALIFIPTALFLFFHCYFPNKQERFILPILPFILILGLIGWNEFVDQSTVWQKRQKILRRIWVWFWIVNCILLIIVSPTYTKKNRVESLYYLSKKNDVKGVVFESFQPTTPNPPLFYLNKPNVEVFLYPSTRSSKDLLIEINAKGAVFPNYIIFLGKEEIEKRIYKFKRDFSLDLAFLATIKPGLIDDLLYRLNPKHNRNQSSYIYRINKRELLHENELNDSEKLPVAIKFERNRKSYSSDQRIFSD